MKYIDIFMGLDRMLYYVHVNGQDLAAVVVGINESESNLVDVTCLPLHVCPSRYEIIIDWISFLNIDYMFSPVSRDTVYTEGDKGREMNFDIFLYWVPLQIFFFLRFPSSMGIKPTYSAGILTGIQNQSCVLFQRSVNCNLTKLIK